MADSDMAAYRNAIQYLSAKQMMRPGSPAVLRPHPVLEILDAKPGGRSRRDVTEHKRCCVLYLDLNS